MADKAFTVLVHRAKKAAGLPKFKSFIVWAESAREAHKFVFDNTQGQGYLVDLDGCHESSYEEKQTLPQYHIRPNPEKLP